MTIATLPAHTASAIVLEAPARIVDADAAIVSALDLAFQAAVKRNDAPAIDRILHPTFYLVLGNGSIVTRDEVVAEARAGLIIYEVQDEDPGTQTVRVWGDTAVVTARLRIRGVREGIRFDRLLWFSDTYVRTPVGWKYAFAQASLPLPGEGSERTQAHAGGL